MYFTSLYIILYSLKNIYESRPYAIYELCGRNKTRYMQDAGLLVSLFRSSTKIACVVRSNSPNRLLLLSNNRRYTRTVKTEHIHSSGFRVMHATSKFEGSSFLHSVAELKEHVV